MLTVTSRKSRIKLAHMTRGVRDELRKDPILSRLSAPEVTVADVRCALQVHATLLSAVERQRCAWGQWQTFSLRRACRALQDDINVPDIPCTPPQLKTSEELLGALYSAHRLAILPGTQHANILAHCPDAPQCFLSLRPDKQMWRLLSRHIEELSTERASFRDIARGALTTVLTMQRVASHARRCLTP